MTVALAAAPAAAPGRALHGLRDAGRQPARLRGPQSAAERPERDAGPRGRGGPRDAALEGDRTGGSAEAARLQRGGSGATTRRISGIPTTRSSSRPQRAGIAVNFNPTGPGPRWAHERTRVKAAQRTYKPNPKQFRKFVQRRGAALQRLVPRREQRPQVLPRVSWWAIWNEPNQPGWLTPQSEKKRGVGMVAAAPHLYRKLLVAGAKGLLATGHADDLPPDRASSPRSGARSGRTGSSRRCGPGSSCREMFCLNRRYRPFTGRAARARGCGNVESLRVLERFARLGLGHHPYTRKASPRKRETQPRHHEHRQRRARCRARSTRSRGGPA